MLVTLNDVLPRAKAEKYAVGLFNTVDLEMAKGVIAAAEELRAPIIIGTAEVLTPFASLEDLSSFLIPLAKKATVPVVLHFDHGLNLDMVKKAINLGFTSVMYDCSTDDYYSNMGRVRCLVQYAHERGVTVEEINRITKIDKWFISKRRAANAFSKCRLFIIIFKSAVLPKAKFRTPISR